MGTLAIIIDDVFTKENVNVECSLLFIEGFLPNFYHAVSAAAGPMSAMPVMMPYSSPVSTVIPVQSVSVCVCIVCLSELVFTLPILQLASPLSVIQPPSPLNMDLVNGECVCVHGFLVCCLCVG